MEKTIKLSQDNKLLLGVCGGVAEAFGKNPNLVRAVWVLVCIFTCNSFLWMYPIVWFWLSKNMKLSQENKMIFGVCGGVAESLGQNPNVVRGVFALLGLITCGWFLVYYLILGLLASKKLV